MSGPAVETRFNEAGFAKLDAALRALDGRFAQIEKAAKKTAGATKNTETRVKELASGVQKAGGAIKWLAGGAVLGVAVAQLDDFARSIAGATAKARDFAKAGAAANDTARAFERLGGTAQDMERLRAATAHAVDDTSLQRFQLLADDLLLTKKEFEGVAKAATALTAKYPELGSVSENLDGILRGEAESLRKVGIVIDANSPKYKGLSEAGRKLAIAQEIAAQAADINTEALDSQSLSMAAASTKLDNFASDLQTFFADVVTGSGFLDDFTVIVDDIKAAFDENKEAIKGFVKNGLNLFIKGLQTSIDLGRKFLHVMDGIDTAMNGSGRVNAAGQLDQSSRLGLLRGVDKDSAGAQALQPLFEAARSGNAAKILSNMSGTSPLETALSAVATSDDPGDVALRNNLQQINTRLQGDMAGYTLSGGLQRDLLALETAINLNTEANDKRADAAAKAADDAFEATKFTEAPTVDVSEDDGDKSKDRKRRRESLLKRGGAGKKGPRTSVADMLLGIGGGAQDMGGDFFFGDDGAFGRREGGFFSGFEANGTLIADLRDQWNDFMEDVDQSLEDGPLSQLVSQWQLQQELVGAIGDTFATSFTQGLASVLSGTEDFRSAAAGMLGDLLENVGAAFAAWGAAETALFSGQWWAGIAAATAMMTAASAVSSLGNRGGKVRGGRGGGGGGARVTADRQMRRPNADQGREQQSKAILELVDGGLVLARGTVSGLNELGRRNTGVRIDGSLVGTAGRRF